MTELIQKQFRFSRMLAQLISHAYILGYTVTMGDVWAREGHKKGSKHYVRLAADINLFFDGHYLRESRAHLPLGVYWESIGGTWGGRWGETRPGAGDGRDGNHYEL